MDFTTDLLIPGLPNEIAFQCLLRVPRRSHPSCRCVCKAWKTLFSDKKFHSDRRKVMNDCVYIKVVLNPLARGKVPKELLHLWCAKNIFYLWNMEKNTLKETDTLPSIFPLSSSEFISYNPMSNANGIYLIDYDFDVYHFDSLKWKNLNKRLPISQRRMKAALLKDFIFVTGQDNNWRENCFAQVFSIKENTWNTLTVPLSRIYSCFECFAIRNKVYLFYHSISDYKVLIYDSINQTWEIDTNMAVCRFTKLYFLINENLYRFSQFILSFDIFRYDFSLQTWVEVSCPPLPKGKCLRKAFAGFGRCFLTIEMKDSEVKVVELKLKNLDEFELGTELTLPPCDHIGIVSCYL